MGPRTESAERLRKMGGANETLRADRNGSVGTYHPVAGPRKLVTPRITTEGMILPPPSAPLPDYRPANEGVQVSSAEPEQDDSRSHHTCQPLVTARVGSRQVRGGRYSRFEARA